jgi:hypothetical protein
MNKVAEVANPMGVDTPRISVGPALDAVHKTALGFALGIVCGSAIFLLTVFHVLLQPTDAPDIGLLRQYFYGYEVSWKGACVGLFWGVVSGFVAGWFIAFVRNLVIAVRVLTLRTKAELAQTKNFLDYI